MIQAPGFPVRSPVPIELAPIVFRPNGVSAPLDVGGFVTSVARSGVGVFQVIIPDQGIMIGRPHGRITGNTASIVVVVDSYVAATRTLQVTLRDASAAYAALDVTAATETYVILLYVFKPNVSQP